MRKTVESRLYQLAAELIESRYPEGWGGAAAAYTSDGRYLTSVAPEVFNASAELCIETGIFCEAAKYNVRITHILCLVRDDKHSEFKILTPCGICQERLRPHGEDVLVAVTWQGSGLRFLPLAELMPYHWGRAYGH